MDFVRSYFGTNELCSDQLNTFFLKSEEKKCSTGVWATYVSTTQFLKFCRQVQQVLKNAIEIEIIFGKSLVKLR